MRSRYGLAVLLGTLLLTGCQTRVQTTVAVQSPPPPPPVPPATASAPPLDALEAGTAALEAQQWADAVVLLRRAVDDDPQDPAATYLLCMALEETQGHSVEVEQWRRQTHRLAPSSVLGRATAPSTLAHVASHPSPRPRPSPPRPVLQSPATSPTPTPTEVAVAPTSAPGSGTPVTPPSASPAPEDVRDGVVVRGTIVRPGQDGQMQPLAGHSVRLMALGVGTVSDAMTDTAGRFEFDPQEPRYDYYVIVVSPMAGEVTYSHYYQPVAGSHGTSYLPVEQPMENRHDLSWHQYLDLSRPGIYELSLDAENADPSYCTEEQPTYDAGNRTAFGSFRVGAPSFSASEPVR